MGGRHVRFVIFGYSARTDGGHNLVGTHASIMGCAFANGVNGNIVGSDPVLGPLADNGGDTHTHALLVRQPGHQRRRHDALTTDQRGVTRPQVAQPTISARSKSICSQPPVAAGRCRRSEPGHGYRLLQHTRPLSRHLHHQRDPGHQPDRPASTLINNATSGVSLVIEGGGYTVDGQDTAGAMNPAVLKSPPTPTVTMNRPESVTNCNTLLPAAAAFVITMWTAI